MQGFYEITDKGMRLLLPSLVAYVGKEFHRVYKSSWWDRILATIKDPYFNLPRSGPDEKLLNSLDLSNCLHLINFAYKDVFSATLPDKACRAWANELICVRNLCAHHNKQDFDQPFTERALNTMVLLCERIDPKTAKDIRILYNEVRQKASGNGEKPSITYTGVPQAAGNSSTTGSGLFKLVNTEILPTGQSVKHTIKGKSALYPVYRIPLNMLYYNDQNDRISTWITQYEGENGSDSLSSLDRDYANRIFESFIYESNPDSIKKTQTNIEIMTQKEPGVTLADGRIVDGNRRFTCLRRLQREKSEQLYFETVLLDLDITGDEKEIKLLELRLQHGVDRPVEYNLIDYAIGTYRDIEIKHLLTVDEYAANSDEAPSEIKNRIDIAQMIHGFLEFINLPEQYHVAREYQVYSLFDEMLPSLKKLSLPDEKDLLKDIVFLNPVLNVFPDQKIFIRNINSLVSKKKYEHYFTDMKPLCSDVKSKISAAGIKSVDDVKKMSESCGKIVESMQEAMENALLQSRSEQLRNIPVENATKCINLLTEVDARLFKDLENEDKDTLKSRFAELEKIISEFKNKLDGKYE